MRGPEECWPWLGARYRSGYGAFSVRHKMYYTHRIAFQIGERKVFANDDDVRELKEHLEAWLAWRALADLPDEIDE